MSGLQRLLARIGNLGARPRRFQLLVTRIHTRILRLAAGRIRRSFLLAGNQPVLILTTTGRRSGTPRSTPVAYVRDGDRLAISGANAGLDRPPAWWLNLQADPHAEIELDGRREAVHARHAAGEEERQLRRRFVDQFAGAEATWSLTDRDIPMVVLERSASSAPPAG